MSEENEPAWNGDTISAEAAVSIAAAVAKFDKRILPTFEAFADCLLDLLREDVDYVDAVRLYEHARMQGVFNQYHDTPSRWTDIEATALRNMLCREYFRALFRGAFFDVFGK
jgi:hypothetical protein